jgi:hypothetical protein
MDKKSFDLLVRLLDSFRHVGWVNGLSGNQYEMLNEANEYVNLIESSAKYRETQVKVAKQLREEGYTIREIAATLGYKNPGSISNLLRK